MIDSRLPSPRHRPGRARPFGPALAAATPRPRWAFIPVALAAALLTGGCSNFARGPSERLLSLVTPYKIEIVQGNPVTKEQAAAVQAGMTRDQVRTVLGSPMLTSAFHADRWDYLFAIRRKGADAERRHVVARFEGDRLKALEGADNLPSEQEFVAAIAGNRTVKPVVLELTEAEKEQLARQTAATARPAAAASAAVATGRSYPPLETAP